MRRIVGSKYENIIEYGCNAHQLNLLAKDLYPKNLVNKIIGVAKFFEIVICHVFDNKILVAMNHPSL